MGVRLIARGISQDVARSDEANTWEQKQTFAGEIEVDGNLNHDGNAIGLFGQTPQLRPAAYNQTAFADATRVVGAPSNEGHALGAVYTASAVNDALDQLAIAINDGKRIQNQIIDDLQARGDFQ